MATTSTRSVKRTAAAKATKAAKAESEKPAKPTTVNVNHPEIVAAEKCMATVWDNQSKARLAEIDADMHTAHAAANGAFDVGTTDHIVALIKRRQAAQNAARTKRGLAAINYPDKVAPTIVTRFRRVYELGSYPCCDAIFENFKSMEISVRGAYAVCVALRNRVKDDLDGDATKLRKAPSISEMTATVQEDIDATNNPTPAKPDPDFKKRPAKFADNVEQMAADMEAFAEKYLANASYFSDDNRATFDKAVASVRSLASAAQRADKINKLLHGKNKKALTAKKAIAAFAEIEKNGGKTKAAKAGATVH
jgi:hypothetical protein